MKKKYLIALSIVIALGALVWFREPVLNTAKAAFGLNAVSNPANPSGAPISTTTLNYMSPGAGTTTVTVNTKGTDHIHVNIFGVASTVATTDIRFHVEFSHSTTSDPAVQLWFPETQVLGGNATTSILTRTAKEYAYRPISNRPHRIATSTAKDGTFDPNTTFSTYFEIPDIAAEWTRIEFYIPTTGASATESTALGEIPAATSTNAGIYVHVTPKDPL